MNSCKGMFFVCMVIIVLTVPSMAVIPIKGNSSHGIGDGLGSWNETTNLLGVTTTSLAYNTLFPSGQQTSQVYAAGNNVYEQLDCSSNSSCDVGDGTAVDFIFQVPVSQIQNGMVTFNNFTGSLSALEIESCSNPTQFAGNPGPGFLCTTYPSGTGNLSVNACQTGTTLTFTLTGSLTNLGSVSFLMQYPNNNSSVSGPTLGLTPAACATTPSILVDFVAAALPLANTPCLNCVNGSTAGTLGLSAPIVYIPHGTSTLQLVLYYHDYSYSGSCKLTFSIAQNKVTLATVTGTISGVTPGTVGYGTGQLPTPAVSPGAALLKGSLKCGTRSIGITGPLFFQ